MMKRCVIAALASFAVNGAFGQAATGRLPGNEADRASPASLGQLPQATKNAKNPDLQAPPRGGNPLWGVPISALSATRERPIFSASRRPPAPPPPIPVAAAPLPPPPPPPEQPHFTLVGTALGKPSDVALVLDQTTKSLVRLHVGESASGWFLRSVEGRTMTLEKESQVVTLSLPVPGATAVAGPRVLNVASGFGRAF